MPAMQCHLNEYASRDRIGFDRKVSWDFLITARGKNLQYRLPPELEDASKFRSYERQRNVTERRKRQGIAHPVPHERLAGVRFFEGMVMNPFPIRAFQLFIDKLVWRIPAADPRPPAHRQPAKKNLIVDKRSFLHANWERREDLKTERWRRKPHEV